MVPERKCGYILLMSLTLIWLLGNTYTALTTGLMPDEQQLLMKLFNEQQYDNSVRPVYNSSQNVEVFFGFTLIQIMDMDEKNQVLVVNAWLEMGWYDARIHWKTEDYNGLEVVCLPARLLWLPDIVLYNNADDYTDGFMPINVMIHHNGEVFWSPPVRLKSSCKVDITYFPFDHQVCKMKFGSWTYEKAQVDLINRTAEAELSRYISNGEWVLVQYRIVRNEGVYPISPAIYPDVTVILTIQRRVLYYVLNILFPCFWLNLLSVLTFCLPPDAGEKITLGITVLLSYSVFMLLVAESMPPTSEFVPLIGIYLTVSMAVASVSVIMTVVVLKLHHCSANQRHVPGWVRFWVLGVLARLVRCTFIRKSHAKTRTSHGHRRLRSNTRLVYTIGDSESDDQSQVYSASDLREMQYKLMKEMESISETTSRFQDKSSRSDVDRNARNNQEHQNHPMESYINRDCTESTRSGYTINCSSFPACVGDPDRLSHQYRTSNRPGGRSQATMEEILKYLKLLVARCDAEDLEEQVVDEWKQVALVTDRFFFWIFLIITVLSAIVLLVIVPSFKNIEDNAL